MEPLTVLSGLTLKPTRREFILPRPSPLKVKDQTSVEERRVSRDQVTTFEPVRRVFVDRGSVENPCSHTCGLSRYKRVPSCL